MKKVVNSSVLWYLPVVRSNMSFPFCSPSIAANFLLMPKLLVNAPNSSPMPQTHDQCPKLHFDANKQRPQHPLNRKIRTESVLKSFSSRANSSREPSYFLPNILPNFPVTLFIFLSSARSSFRSFLKRFLKSCCKEIYLRSQLPLASKHRKRTTRHT